MPIHALYNPDVDLEALNEKRIDALVDREPDIAVRLEACHHDKPHEHLICARCSEAARMPYINELLRIVDEHEGRHEIATVYLMSVPARQLDSVGLLRVKDSFRTRLRRCGFGSSFLGGGVEVAWFNRPGVWTVHSHLLTAGVSKEAWTRLAETLKGSGARNPVQVGPLRDTERQVSYLQKFTTYQKLYLRGGQGAPLVVPLPPDRLAELARWWSRYTFDDFPFLFGARRRGGRIVLERSLNPASPRR